MRAIVGLGLGKEPEAKYVIANIITNPIASLPFIGYPSARIAKAMLGFNTSQPNFSTISMAMVEDIMLHAYQTAKGINYLFNDEYIQNGTDMGKKKSTVNLRKGITGTFENFLILNGVPTKYITQIEWFKKDY